MIHWGQGTIRLVCVLGGVLGLAMVAQAPEDPVPPPPVPRRPPPVETSAYMDLDRPSLIAKGRNLFRVHRSPALSRYDPRATLEARMKTAEPPPPRIPRPGLELRGIIAGPEPMVLVSVTDAPGTLVLSVGDSIAGVVVHRISPDSVVFAHPDTAWTFMIAEPWDSTGAVR